METIKNKSRNYLNRLQNYSDIRLILEISLIINIPKIIILLLFILARMSGFLDPNEIFHNNMPTHPALRDIFFSTNVLDTIFYIFSLVIIVPIFETLFAQYLPIKISSYFTKNNFNKKFVDIDIIWFFPISFACFMRFILFNGSTFS